MHEAEKKLNEMKEDYEKLNDDYYELQHSKDMMAKEIDEKEEENRDLKNLTKNKKMNLINY